MSYAIELKKEIELPTITEKIRIIFGLLMMISGLYFGLFSAGAAEGLGFLSFLASPFVIVSGK